MRRQLYILILWWTLTVPIWYMAIANAVFTYRNPLANQASFYREFRAVVTFQKLPEYQPRRPWKVEDIDELPPLTEAEYRELIRELRERRKREGKP